MNVLIVDDQPRLIRVTAAAFRTLGCHPFLAATLAEADRMLETMKIDALFLDVNLGRESGWEFLSHVRKKPHAPPVVMFSAMAEDDVIDEAVRGGAFGCLAKPFSVSDLRRHVILIRQHLRDCSAPSPCHETH